MSSEQNKSQRGWQLKTIVIINILIVIIFIGSLITLISGILQYRDAQSKNQIIMDLISSNINDLVCGLMKDIEVIAKTMGDLSGSLDQTKINPERKAFLETFLTRLINNNAYIEGTSVTGELGQNIRIFKNTDGNIEVLETLPLFVTLLLPANLRKFETKFYQNFSSPNQKLVSEETHNRNATSFPVYQRFKDKKEGSWIDSRAFSHKELKDLPPVLSYVLPVIFNDKLQAIITVDLGVQQLQKYLTKLTKEKFSSDYNFGGVPFILEKRTNGEIVVIGHPDPAYLTSNFEIGSTSVDNKYLLLANKHPDSRIRTFANLLDDEIKNGGDPFLKTPIAVKTAIDNFNNKWFYTWNVINPGMPPDWIVGICAREDLVEASTYQALKITGLTLFVVTIFGVFLCIALSNRLTKPLRHIAKDVVRIGEGDIAYSNKPLPFVKELKELAEGIEKMKTGILSFRKFIPAKLVCRVIQSRKTAEPFAEKKLITLFFSDLENFTTISETLDPDKLVKFIGNHLALCTNIIQLESGTVDKYIGDSVMAFWNAPDITPDHQIKACLAALACQEEMKNFNSKNMREGLPSVNMRIGIHTGFAFVGNIGSEDRLNYTAVGDSVNLASRLEGTNKIYGTSILISEGTYQEVKGGILTRPVDKVAVKGKSISIMIYEVLGTGKQEDLTLDKVIEFTTLGFDHYQQQRFNESILCYQEVLKIKPEDKLSLLFIKRCEEYLVNPPPPSWDGSFHNTGK